MGKALLGHKVGDRVSVQVNESYGDEKNRDIEDLKRRGILLDKYLDGADGPLEFLRLNSLYKLFIQEAGIHRIIRGENPFGLIEV